MGNSPCSEVYRMGLEAGMIPDPHMDHTFTNYLSINSCVYLNSHYTDVRNSLSPDQLETFDSSVRATLGQNGTVTQGGVGVVALALSLLFDVLAQQAKNETEKTHFIHQIFRDHQKANSTGSKVGTVVLDYLNLVPLIANDPQRMMEETERYKLKLNHTLVGHFESTYRTQNSSWTEWKILIHGFALRQHMMIHQVRMGADIPMEGLFEKPWKKRGGKSEVKGLVEITNIADRLLSIRPEKNETLEKCKDKDSYLFTRFVLDVVVSGEKFFAHVERHSSQFFSQREDFDYQSKSCRST